MHTVLNSMRIKPLMAVVGLCLCTLLSGCYSIDGRVLKLSAATAPYSSIKFSTKTQDVLLERRGNRYKRTTINSKGEVKDAGFVYLWQIEPKLFAVGSGKKDVKQFTLLKASGNKVYQYTCGEKANRRLLQSMFSNGGFIKEKTECVFPDWRSFANFARDVSNRKLGSSYASHLRLSY